MNDDDLLTLLASTVDPTLRAAGFSAAQGGWEGVTWCMAQEAFIERYGWLPQARPEDWQRGQCVDLVIEFDQTTGLLAHLDLEGRTVAATAHRTGRGELADRLAASLALPLPESLPVVAEVLDALFTPPTRGARGASPEDWGA